jgi:hypothetical protein
MAACDRILGLEGVEVVVPGHGPLAGLRAVADMKGYFDHLSREVRARYEAGMGPTEAAYDIDMSPYDDWGECERVVINVNALYREYGVEVPSGLMDVFGQMAAYRQHARARRQG